jgi:septal ring factor EnvC (AmiA/AmiB activator)
MECAVRDGPAFHTSDAENSVWSLDPCWANLLACELWTAGSSPARRTARDQRVLTIGSTVNEQELRRHLDEAHRQLLERDHAYRFHEEEMRSRDHEIEQLRQQLGQLREQLAEAQAWANELKTNMQEMQETRAWRLAVRLRSLRSGAGKVMGR